MRIFTHDWKVWLWFLLFLLLGAFALVNEKDVVTTVVVLVSFFTLFCNQVRLVCSEEKQRRESEPQLTIQDEAIEFAGGTKGSNRSSFRLDFRVVNQSTKIATVTNISVTMVHNEMAVNTSCSPRPPKFVLQPSGGSSVVRFVTPTLVANENEKPQLQSVRIDVAERSKPFEKRY